MNYRQRRNVEALKRRRDRLADRLLDWRGRDKGRTSHELNSLNWVIRVVEKADERGILKDLE